MQSSMAASQGPWMFSSVWSLSIDDANGAWRENDYAPRAINSSYQFINNQLFDSAFSWICCKSQMQILSALWAIHLLFTQVPVLSTLFCQESMNMVMVHIGMNDNGCAPVSLYLRTLKTELYAIFTCMPWSWVILLTLSPPNLYKQLTGHMGRGVWLGLVHMSLLSPERRDRIQSFYLLPQPILLLLHQAEFVS